MALPTLDATFASAADLPRRQMLANWLVEELGEVQAPSNVLVSGAGSDAVNGLYIEAGVFDGKKFYNLQSGGYVIAWDNPNWVIRNIASITLYTSDDNVEFPWQVTTWSVANGSEPVPAVNESPAVNPIANYYDLPERYLWAKIAVAAGAPRPEEDYISLPKNYAWSDIYNAVAGLIPPSNVLVSGAGSDANGLYFVSGEQNGRPSYEREDGGGIFWNGDRWSLDANIDAYEAVEDVAFPWLVESWQLASGEEPLPIVTESPVPTPNHTDWTEKQALGHIAAAYRGDTGNPEALATYIDWPWRYKVASIITSL